jgi:hypothetical protein
MELLDDVRHVESHFGMFGDSASVSARYVQICTKHTIGSEIILDAPDGTLRWCGHVGSRFGPFGDSLSVGA